MWKKSGSLCNKADMIADFINGLPLQKYRATTSDYLPVIKIREMKNGLSENTERVRTDLEPTYIVKNGDILFSWSGTLELMIWYQGNGALNQHIFKVIPKGYPKWLCYQQISINLPQLRKIAEGKATTMGHIQRHHLSETWIIVPPFNTLNKMDRIMDPIFKIQLLNNVSIQNISMIRDMLLPKLISGEILI